MRFRFRLVSVLLMCFVILAGLAWSSPTAHAQLDRSGITDCDIDSFIYQHPAYDNCSPLTLDSCGATVDINLNGNDNAEKAYNFFITQGGLTAEQAAGLVGNFVWESHVGPTVTNSIGAHGIAQWLSGRRTGLTTFASQHPELGGEDTLETQLAYVLYEFKNGERGAYEDLKTQTTVEGAANSVFKLYERAGDSTGPNRVADALAVKKAYNNGTGGASVTITGGNTGCNNVSSAGQNSQFVDNFRIYSQYDPAWARKPYGTSNIADSGCGPSAMAMIITALTGQTITPDQVAAYADQFHVYVPGVGSSWNLPAVTAPHWDLKATPIGASAAKITATIRAGGLVIASGQGAKPYTSHGHYLVIRGVTADGQWKIGDSGHNDTSSQIWDPQALLTSMNDGSVYAVTR